MANRSDQAATVIIIIEYSEEASGDIELSMAGVVFQTVITIVSFAGLLYCFRRASTFMPRNISIQLENIFTGHSDGRRRGPIALSDEDMAGATGIDWDELEEAGLDGTATALDNDDSEDGEQDEEDSEDEGQELQESRRGTAFSRFRDDHDRDDDAEENHSPGRHVSISMPTDPKQPKDSQFKLSDDDEEGSSR
ncbi:hypothetical protein BGZ94_001391 [Podila epigama]|nr:hypothetical protein BGZ94_001391 [Podila epigama]